MNDTEIQINPSANLSAGPAKKVIRTGNDARKRKSWLLFGLLMMVSSTLAWFSTSRGIASNLTDSVRNDSERIDSSSILSNNISEAVGVVEADLLHLSNKLLPEHYDLTLKVYLPGYSEIDPSKNLTFEAQVDIQINVRFETNSIILNSKDLVINQQSIDLIVNEKHVPIKGMSYNPENEQTTFFLPGILQPNDTVIIKIEYTGKINQLLEGLYQSHFVENQVQKIVAATQFAPIAARRMVPCFDEPTMKASWSVTVIHPKGTHALSNGQENSTTSVDDNFEMTTFAETPKMSSYLLAIIISDFVYIEGKTASGLRFRVYARKEHADSMDWALECGIKAIDFFEKHFEIRYALSKIDMVALPDFEFEAMENWGLVTYRETALIYNPKTDDLQKKKFITSVVVHELSHQWFGNLVTTKEWGHVWLNEGFATYSEFVAISAIIPDYKIYDLFLVEDQEKAFMADRYANSNPMTFSPEIKTNILEAFSTITYQKGAMVLHMIRTVMGSENFFKGLRKYLERHSYDTVTPENLFAALDEVLPAEGLKKSNNQSIKEFAMPWTTQMGYPYMTVTKTASGFKITQNRYKLLQNIKEKNKYQNPKYGYKWTVPISYIEDDGQLGFEWFRSDQEALTISSTSKQILLNAGSNMFHRSNYDEEGWNNIITALEKDINAYSYVNRKVIISDAFAMSSIQKLDYATLFKLIEVMAMDTNYVSITTLINAIEDLLSKFEEKAAKNVVKAYLRKLLTKLKDSTSLESIIKTDNKQEIMYENFFRADVYKVFYNLGDELVAKEMTELYKKECGGDNTSNCKRIPSRLRQSVYCAGGNLPELLKLYRLEENADELETLLNAIACHEKAWPSLEKTLYEGLYGNGSVRAQSAHVPFRSAAKNEEGTKNLIGFFINNWKLINARFGDKLNTMGHVIKAVMSTISTREQLQKISNFLKRTPLTKTIQSFDTNYELALYRVQWIEKNKDEVLRLVNQRLDRA